MSYKGLFFVIPVLLLTAFLSHAQQMGLYPLTQYSVGQNSNVQLRTTTTTVQDDTLKIPYIEDFSGPGLPIDSISVDTLPSLELVYRITHLKMHGLKSGTNIHVYNATGGTTTSGNINGSKYAKVIDKYSFQLFNDAALTIPALVTPSLMHYCNWSRAAYEGYSTSPDTLGFLDNNGGVFINNDMAVNPISIGVASFDGVNYKGVPYSTTTAKGYADNLTSLPFNLSMYAPIDSIYMSFYWQSKSLGNDPISSEFLSLEFYNASGNWVEVWRQYGNTTTVDTFIIAMIPIKNTSYLHKAFKYRFRSYGVLNGRFNVWNLDYIYIDSHRTKTDTLRQDITIISTSRSALKNYTSVPYKHIKDLPVATITNETAEAFMKIRDNLNNYTSTPANAIERQHLVRDNLNNASIKYSRDPLIGGQTAPIFIQSFPDTIPGGYMTEPYSLKEEFFYQPVDTFDRIDLTFNNMAAIETYFSDSYAYDDNTPEVAFISVNAGGTKIANAYKILATDQLTHIDYCFIKNNGIDLTNSVITMNVWKRTSKGVTAKDTIKLISIYSQQIAISYSPYINGFVRYELTTPLTLGADTVYYFGYTQNFNNALFLGYDKNNDHIDKIFYCNDGNTWLHFEDNISTVPGSLMIRPVFSDGEIITGTTDPITQQYQFSFYPNPAKSELHFTGEPEYISIYDLSGLLLLEKKIEGTEMITTETLTNGLYLIILSKGDYQEVKRLIIQK